MSLNNWSRSPKHILRKKCLDDVIKNFRLGCFLELGAGNGDLTKFFIDKGFNGKCYDIGFQTRVILREIFSSYDVGVIDVLDGFDEVSENYFDYLFAFEVLEHIENDIEALISWSRYLKSGGILLLSVPAHMQAFGLEDRAVGHYRRYEKNELYSMLEQCGYQDIIVYNYGFPLGNITRKISAFLRREKIADKQLTMEQKSILSGIERGEFTNRVSFLFNDYTLLPFILIQRFFYSKDLGDGYILCAKKL